MLFYNFNRRCPEGSVPYTVRAGDTLSRIAEEYNTTVQYILNVNPGIDPNALMINQQICVPTGVQIYPSCPTTNYYVVRTGDTFSSIADYFNVSYRQLLYSNYGIDPQALYLDQILCIPVAPSPVSVHINAERRRLTVYRNGAVLRTYSISAVIPSEPIPKGSFTVLNKQVDTSIGPGARWIGLSGAGLGIRGENTAGFIDVVASGTSIVMSDQNVSELFNLVPVGTTVNVL